MSGRYAPPGPSLYPECGSLTGYKRHTQEGTVSCARCREAARLGEARYRKHRYLYGPRKISALGARRRVQALAAIGWTYREIGERMTPPISSEAVGKLIRFDTTYRDKAEQIARVYDELWNTPGTSVKTRRRAEASGWFPPMDWDDDRLDDPDYVPLAQVLRDWAEALEIERKRQRPRTPEQAERDRVMSRLRKQRYRERAREQAAA